MKIRFGWVLNSSSSNFRVVLKKPIEQYSFEEFKKDYKISYKYNNEANRLFKDLIAYSCYIQDILNNPENYIDIKLSVWDGSLVSYEEEQEIKAQLKNLGIKLLKDKINKNLNIVDDVLTVYNVEYRQEDECMENSFMPKFRGTVKQEKDY